MLIAESISIVAILVNFIVIKMLIIKHTNGEQELYILDLGESDIVPYLQNLLQVRYNAFATPLQWFAVLYIP